MTGLEDILYRLLYLEEQLESYKRLHAEEQRAMANALSELRREIVSLLASEAGRNGSSDTVDQSGIEGAKL